MEATRKGGRAVYRLSRGARRCCFRETSDCGSRRLYSGTSGGSADLVRQSLADVGRALAEGRTTSEEVTRACLLQADHTATLNAFVSRHSDEHLLSLAALSDKRRRDGHQVGKLEGIPVAVKDSFNTHDLPTTPPCDAAVVSALRKEGAIIMGKTNMDEFSMGSGNTQSYFGPVINPWSPSTKPEEAFVAGGSSGGSAAAVASDSCFGALGGDTGGSVRLPGAYCGVVGFKPSYGRISRWGLVAYGSSLDTPGVLTKTVEDAAIMLGVLAGMDARDSTSVDIEVPDYVKSMNQPRKLRVGIPKEYLVKELSEDTRKLWEEGAEAMAQQGAEVVEISLPHTQYALPAYYILAPAEASSNLSRYDGLRYGYRGAGDSITEMYSSSRSEGFGEEVQRRILLGTFTLSRRLYDSYYRKAQQIRRLVLNDFETAFGQGVDVLLHPTAPTPAFALAEKLNPVDMYINDIMTIPASMAGLPAVSVPVRQSAASNLPQGLQLVGRYMDEGTLLAAARLLEQAFPRAHALRPPLA
ncbi:aspartyl/glutamyltRNA(Asn/Gln) amidotransferase, A subunit [Acanthamoeba castellanii str. Neff]|uniref:Glutamyl-tRNA(Gln) amidotransferase subunit A, mitochondrial n=1 Tax=Acanthamoeba castellanii (strain ATCC 30010 / Neff) TaxID=1257118 RepID=L8H9I7_ACACF|nr:aspartyl/glutamyltRNA(Asn/Gln) amidotransferase, A subunit [Acanthamoeba castellanii str. Neff]ELR22159.1 aspartyl/glutamyltRNA(Asn/Gln) amidotransferase, A subunit [Acanthamoeba castellanii str. Neff]